MNMHFLKLVCAALFCLLPLLGCENKTAAESRAELLAQNDGDVVLAVAWPLKSVKGTLLEGIQMAVDENNARGGVLGGKKLRLLLKDDESSLTHGRLVAQEIANAPEVSAVIGHLNTYVAYPASQIYERAGLLMVTPGASGQKITDGDARLVFRSLPGNRDQGRQIGDYASAKGYKNIVIYYIKNDYGIDLANNFEQRANELGIHVVDRRSYNKESDNHAAIFADWASFLKFDAIFLVGSLPEGPHIIRSMRRAGISVPIFAGVGLDSPDLIKSGGKDVEQTVVFTLFNPDSEEAIVQQFNQRFRQRYGRKPDSHAAQGYDTVQLLVQAIERSQSRLPEKIAIALRSTKGWRGITGEYTYSEKGDLVAKRLALGVVHNGEFSFVNDINSRKLPAGIGEPGFE